MWRPSLKLYETMLSRVSGFLFAIQDESLLLSLIAFSKKLQQKRVLFGNHKSLVGNNKFKRN